MTTKTGWNSLTCRATLQGRGQRTNNNNNQKHTHTHTHTHTCCQRRDYQTNRKKKKKHAGTQVFANVFSALFLRSRFFLCLKVGFISTSPLLNLTFCLSPLSFLFFLLLCVCSVACGFARQKKKKKRERTKTKIIPQQKQQKTTTKKNYSRFDKKKRKYLPCLSSFFLCVLPINKKMM